MRKPRDGGGPDRVAPIQTADDAEQSPAILHDAQELDNPQDPRTLTIKGLRARRQSKPCAIRGCDHAGTVAPGIVGNQHWFCWGHFVEVEAA